VNTRTLLFVLLAIGFVGATSCGDDKNQQLAAENAQLRMMLAQRNAQGNTAVVTVNQVQTAIANVTVTQASSSVTTNNGVTVVYTVTNTTTGTRQ
jgi:hypothetical protein